MKFGINNTPFIGDSVIDLFSSNIVFCFSMIGGMAESHAYMGEGLATALVFFDDLHEFREAKQRHCILICNSPPYNFPIMECEPHAGRSVDQMANLFQEVFTFFIVNRT